jgi:hypothetical protein
MHRNEGRKNNGQADRRNRQYNGQCNGQRGPAVRRHRQQENFAPSPAVSPDPRPLARVEAATRDFVARIRREFPQELAHDPKELRTAVLRQVRQTLPLRRGRPNDPRIDAAMRMREQGKSVKEILRLQIRGFDKLDTYGRYLAEKGLRTAIARRHKRNMPASGN